MKRDLRRTTKEMLGRIAGMAGMYSRRFRSQMTIVAFHRVTDVIESDGLTCSPEVFEEFCKFFERYFEVMPLGRQIEACAAGADLGGTLAITFDDGYADNAEVAAPILQRLKLPATFFVTSGFVDSPVVAPWDAKLKAGVDWMTWKQLRTLRDNGFEIGNHTETHIDMGTAEPSVVRAELASSRAKLVEELGIDTRLFAYPFGGRQNISPRSRDLVREAGFSCCLSCFGGVNPSHPDPFELNRIGIAEWFASPDQFGYELLRGKA